MLAESVQHQIRLRQQRQLRCRAGAQLWLVQLLPGGQQQRQREGRQRALQRRQRAGLALIRAQLLHEREHAPGVSRGLVAQPLCHARQQPRLAHQLCPVAVLRAAQLILQARDQPQ